MLGKSQTQNMFMFRLYDIVTQKCGSGAADTVRAFRAEQYPLVVVIMKNRSSLEVSAVIQGNICISPKAMLSDWHRFCRSVVCCKYS